MCQELSPLSAGAVGGTAGQLVDSRPLLAPQYKGEEEGEPVLRVADFRISLLAAATFRFLLSVPNSPLFSGLHDSGEPAAEATTARETGARTPNRAA